MKVIDLLNKIANEEEVPHFIIDEQEYYLGANGFLKELYGDEVEWVLDAEWLNTEVEIIEEPKEIKKLDRVDCSALVDLQSNSSLIEQNKAVTNLIMYLNINVSKINELIDVVNELKKENK